MRWATVSILILIWNWLCWRSFICSSRVTFIPSPSNTVHQEQELSGQDEGLPSPLTSVGLEHWWTLAGDQRNKESEVGCLLLYTIASSVKDHILFKAVFCSLSTLLLFPLLIGVVMGHCYRASGSVLSFVVFLLPVHCFEYSIVIKLSLNYLIWEVICFLPVPYLIHWDTEGLGK